MAKDTIYNHPFGDISNFQFDETVAQVFNDMIQRSVPGYASIIHMIGTLAEKYVQADSYCYDLGCSLGAASLAMRSNIHHNTCKIFAIDNSPAMIKRCKQNLNTEASSIPILTICDDIENIEITNSSMVVMNFTLQFIPPAKRLNILQNIYQGLLPEGLLVLSEKISFSNQHLQELYTELHHAFKKSNGYTDLEISSKRTALEQVLIPESLQTHQQRLQQAGFSSCDPWFQCFNFMSLCAVK